MLQRVGFARLGVLLAILFWPLEALLHTFLFGHESFLDNLISADANENWMRLLMSATLIGFGVFAQRSFMKQQELQHKVWKKGKRLQEIIDRSYDAYVSTDESGVVTEWNRSAEALFGWPRRKIMGKPLETIIPARMHKEYHQGMRQYRESSIGSWLYKPMQIKALHHDGSEFLVEIVVTPLNIDGPTEFFAFIRKQGN